jgi:hypothetical protein
MVYVKKKFIQIFEVGQNILPNQCMPHWGVQSYQLES